MPYIVAGHEKLQAFSTDICPLRTPHFPTGQNEGHPTETLFALPTFPYRPAGHGISWFSSVHQCPAGQDEHALLFVVFPDMPWQEVCAQDFVAKSDSTSVRNPNRPKELRIMVSLQRQKKLRQKNEQCRTRTQSKALACNAGIKANGQKRCGRSSQHRGKRSVHLQRLFV